MCLTVIGVGTKILYGVAAEIQSFEQCSEKSEGSSHVGIWGQSNPHRAGKLQVGKVLKREHVAGGVGPGGKAQERVQEAAQGADHGVLGAIARTWAFSQLSRHRN